MREERSAKQMSKRILTGLLVALLLMLLGCGKKPATQTEEPETDEPAVTTETTEPVENGMEPALSSDGQKIEQFQLPKEGDLCAEIVIAKYGSIFVKLFEEECPMAVENFTKLAKEGYYDNMKINRVLADYMFQSGNPNQDGGESIYGGGFKNEISETILPYRGALCMANMGEDGTNTSQFFVVQTQGKTLADMVTPLDSRYNMTIYEYFQEAYGVTLTEEQWNSFCRFGGAPQVYGYNTVFGQTYEGFEIIDRIGESKVTSKLKPNPSITIETIRIFTFGED